MTALPPWMGELGRLAVLSGLTGVLGAALVLQFSAGEVPCPLCLIERVGMFGVAFAVLGQARHGWSSRRTGLALLWSLFLLIVSARQVLLDLCPRPGHAYVGSAVLGLHMPVWSVVIALALLLAFVAELTLLDPDAMRAAPTPAVLARPTAWLGWALLALCAVNLVAVLLQCGFGQCHTTGYALLTPV